MKLYLSHLEKQTEMKKKWYRYRWSGICVFASECDAYSALLRNDEIGNGNEKWKWKSETAQTNEWTMPLIYYLCFACAFATGWSNAPDEKATKYRLTIKDIQQQESGTYTCTSPRGLTNSIVIIVASNLYVRISSLSFLLLAHSHCPMSVAVFRLHFVCKCRVFSIQLIAIMEQEGIADEWKAF